MKQLLPLLLLAVPALGGAAALKLTVELPQIDVAEYHRPYLAVWIEREDNTAATNLAVWYQQKRGEARRPRDGKPPQQAGANGPGGGESGTKWLPDLRQWWRRSGRSQTLPIDGVTGATRPVGVHEIVVDGNDARLKDLAPGSYRLVVEAARESGGRELLKIPFSWPAASAQTLDAQGKSELGKLTLTLSP
jgi:hypothetical protein